MFSELFYPTLDLVMRLIISITPPLLLLIFTVCVGDLWD